MTGKSKEKSEKDAVSAEEKESEVPTPVEPTLEEQLAKANEEIDSWKDTAARRLADFDNYRKRTERENAEFRKFACSGLVTELLNIADDLERALATAADAEDPFAVGVKAVRGNLVKILESQGVTEIPTDGKFDPNMHEALMTVEGDEDDMVAQVYQKGYMMHGRVLRYAKVTVTKKKEADEAPEQEEPAKENNTEN